MLTVHQSERYVQIMRWFVFQPCTVTSPDLGYVSMLNTLFCPTRPTCLIRSGYFLVPSYVLPPPPISSRSLSLRLYATPAPLHLSWRSPPSTWASPTLATFQIPPLVSTPRVACLRLLLFLCTLSPPVLPSACTHLLISS